MANYISTLTGTQMDAAMTDMANHVSEAWAVGERNGVAVASGDVTYQNNAKYYAEQANTQITSGVERAEAAAARAEAAVPSGTAGAVFFDRAQTLTEAQASQARANIKDSNPNLLRNWYFVGGGSQLGAGHFPINQRGKTTYGPSTSAEYVIDGWYKQTYPMLLTLNTDCIELSTVKGFIRQHTEEVMPAGQYTFSAYVKVSNANAQLQILKASDATLISYVNITPNDEWTLHKTSGTLDADDRLVVRFRAVENTTVLQVKSCKLERGNNSTLPNDVPPTFSEELFKCTTSIQPETTEGLSQPADPYANRPYVGGSNRNLCDNPFFTVNQRGQATYTASSLIYTVDRWALTLNGAGTGTLTVDDNGVTIANGYSGGKAYFVERLDEDVRKFIDGKVVTMSVLYQDGTIKSGTDIFNLGTTLNIYADDGEISMRVYSPTTERAEPTVDIDASKTISIRAVKLELGSVSTLANDTIPNYAEELAKCQRFFWTETFPANTQLCVTTSINASTAVGNLVAPVPLRANPTLTFSANVGLVGSGAIAMAIGVTSANVYGNIIRIVLSSSGLSALNLYSFITQTNTIMTLSADL